VFSFKKSHNSLLREILVSTVELGLESIYSKSTT